MLFCSKFSNNRDSKDDEDEFFDFLASRQRPQATSSEVTPIEQPLPTPPQQPVPTPQQQHTTLFQPFEPQILPTFNLNPSGTAQAQTPTQLFPTQTVPIGQPNSVDLFSFLPITSLAPGTPNQPQHQPMSFQPLQHSIQTQQQQQSPFQPFAPQTLQPIQSDPMQPQLFHVGQPNPTEEIRPVICYTQPPLLAQPIQSSSVQPHSQLQALNQIHSQFGNLHIGSSGISGFPAPNSATAETTPTQPQSNQFDFVQLF